MKDVSDRYGLNKINNSDSWNILVVDDDHYVHILIKEMLKEFSFNGKSFTVLSAYSSMEALDILYNSEDIALVLLDVFIEESDSGLKLSKYIREIVGNLATRIVLMTNRMNKKLEEDAILNYDINGYEDKTELLSNKLLTVIISALGSYKDILQINNNKKIMEQVALSSPTLLKADSLENFITSALLHLNFVINLNQEDPYHINGLAALRSFDEKAFKIVAGYGKYENSIGNMIMETISKEEIELVREAYKNQYYIITEDIYTSYYNSSSGVEGIVFLEIEGNIDHLDGDLLDIFNNNIVVTFESLCLNKEIEQTQKELLYLLGEVTEARSEETGDHVKRVSEYSKLIARKCGLSKREIMLVSMASPIHDIGKIAIPDNILLKPGKLIPEEFDIVKTHTTIGYNLLKHSDRDILKSAAIIAHEHHERYDGKGYPRGLKGEEIHIFGRIAAVADVFDALGSPRVYKKAWIMEDILNYFRQEKGKHFDPILVDVLFDNLDEFLEIKEKYSDEEANAI